MAEKISLAELDWDASLLEKSIQNYTQKLQVVKKEQDGVVVSLNTMTSEYEKLSKVINLFSNSDKSANVELEKNKKQMDELKASMQAQAETIAKLQAQIAQLNKERSRANEILEMTKQKEKANSEASQKNAQTTLISLQKVNKELEKTQNVKVTTVDLNVDSFLGKAAEARKQVEILKGEVKYFTDAIKENEKIILKDSEVLGSLARQGKTNSDEYKERARLIKELQDKNKGLRSELELNASALRKEQQELRNAQRQVDAFNKTLVDEYEVIVKTDGSINQLSQALANNRKIYQDLTTEQRNNIEVGGRLLNIIEAQDKEYKELQKSTGVNQVEVGNYRGQLEGLFDSMQGGNSLIGGLTDSFKQLYSSLLSIGTNPIGATLIALAGVAKLTKMWYDYNVEMSKSTRLVQQFTSLSGDALTDLTVKIRTLAEESGESEKQVVNAVNAVANSMGLTYGEAFEKVQNGFIRSGESAEDFFDNTSEYITHFNNMGYSADEFFSIMEEGAKGGAYKDKLIDTIKEFSIRFNDLNKAGKESLENTFGKAFTDNLIKQYKAGEIQGREVLDSLIKKGKELGVSFKDTGAVVANVMGAMGEDAGGYEQIVKAVNDGLANTHRELTEIEKARQIEIESTEALNQKWAELFNTSGGTFEMMKAQGKAWVNGFLIKMIDGVIDFANGFIDVYNNSLLVRYAISRIGFIFKTQFNIANAVLKTFWSNLKTTGKLLASILTFDFSGAMDALRERFQDLKNIASDTAGSIKEDFTGAFDTTKNGKIEKIKKTTASDLAFNEQSQRVQNTITGTNSYFSNLKPTKPINDDKKTEDKKKKTGSSKEDKEAVKQAQEQLKALQAISNSQLAVMKAELDEFVRTSESKLDESKRTNEKLLQLEIERLKDIENRQKAYLDQEAKNQIEQANKTIKNEQEKNAKILEITTKLGNEKIKLESETDKKIQENKDKYNAQILAEQKQAKALEFKQKIEALISSGASEYLIKSEQIKKEYQQNEERIKLKNELEEITTQEQALEMADINYEIDQATLERKAYLNSALYNMDYEYKNALIQLQQEAKFAELEAYTQIAQGVAQIMGEQTMAGKAAAIASTTISTYASIVNTLETFTKKGLPIPGYAIAQAIATGVFGFAQVAKIAGVDIGNATEGLRNVGKGVVDSMQLVTLNKNTPGYFKGGYTGGSSIYEERGVVHGKEVVFNNEDVAAYGGWQNIELLRPTSSMFQGFPVNAQMILASSQNSNNFDLSALSSSIKLGVYEGALNGSRIGSLEGSQIGSKIGSQIGSLEGSQAGSQKGISQLSKNQRISDGAGF